MKEEKLFSFAHTARILSIGPGVLGKDFKAGKIKGELRGKRIKFSQADIDEYRKNQRIDNSITEVDLADFPELRKIEVEV